jgi:hypothetical protein
MAKQGQVITPEVLGILGFLTITVLGINAYFLKSIVESLNQVKIQTATLIEKTSFSEQRLQSVEAEIEMIRGRLTL